MEHDRYFNGVIGGTFGDSTASWITRPTALKQSPNIVMIAARVGYINRADLADFLAKQVMDTTYSQQAISITS